MEITTLTIYLIAGALSASLGVVLLAFAHFRPGTLVAKNCFFALSILAAGFLVAGFRPVLPAWVTVIATNMVLLSSGPILHSGFAAYCTQREATLDRWGWALVALTGPAFWYWGLIEPNGNYRSAVFSLATAAVNGRTAFLLLRQSLRRAGGPPVWCLALVFGGITVWMVLRGVLSLAAEPALPELRGANPTLWITVFWYIVLVSLMTVCVLWLEIERQNLARPHYAGGEVMGSGLVEGFRNKLVLLWGAAIILALGVVGELGVVYTSFSDAEQERLTRSTTLANEAFAQHTLQVAGQIDSILRAVRGFHVRTHSLADTEAFIDTLGFDRSIIDNFYLIAPDGRIVISHDAASLGHSVADRDYFAFHRSTPEDQLFIAPVEIGRVTGKYNFRISRRIEGSNGRFGGIVLAAVKPESFTRYFGELSGGGQNTASLLGIIDRKLRARLPETSPERWLEPIESPLWRALEEAPAGVYENTSAVDDVHRVYAYRRVGELPLVMVTGFSSDDLAQSVRARMSWFAATAAGILLLALLLALLLTIEVRRRIEQDRFLSMLSHELKSPMSVIRMALGIADLPPTIRQSVEHAVMGMNAVVNRCLQLNRLRYGRLRPVSVPCKIDEVLQEVLVANACPQLPDPQLEDLPSCKTDSRFLSIILGNLVDNALKYGAPDAKLKIAAVPQQYLGRAGVRVEIANAPGAAGMPDPRRVFRKYYRALGARGKTGAGLGLHIASGFAKKIGARLSYHPGANEVKFELWIPR